MMKWVWSGMLLFGVLLSFLRGDPSLVVDAMLRGTADAVTLCLSLAGAYLLWMGLMGIAKEAGLMDALARKMRPLIKRLMPNAGSAAAPITLNFAANFLGLGNAATPFGLAAMQELEKGNPTPGKATHDMCMFLCINASAIQLIPTTVISLMVSAGSRDPYRIVLPTLLATLASTVTAVLLCLLFRRKRR
ncbi:MAG: nucleoside recognition protein [Clostridia bacterium]|nr:nucleoside recognition protein [Clostridia bacterium]